ncbi:MAG: toxin-antitoxin system HicB family antitoxin [Anaerolineaceae bacterium]|nr:toxin-antitoxin system HicB family antitoxin [Anaerolineaceae bacterium]
MGRFTLRLPETLHNELENRAQQEGVSLNQYIVYMLTRQVASTYTIQVLPEKTVREQKASYERLLDSLGEASLERTKAFLAEREPAEPDKGLTDEVVARLKKRIEESSA